MNSNSRIATLEDIESLVVTGIPGSASALGSGATVFARHIGTAIVHDVDANDSSACGISADFVGSYTRYVGKVVAKRLTKQGNHAGTVDEIPGSGYSLDVI